MPRFWVEVRETLTHKLLVEAPSMEAASTWAYSDSDVWVRDGEHKADSLFDIACYRVRKLAEVELMDNAPADVQIDEKGEEIPPCQ